MNRKHFLKSLAGILATGIVKKSEANTKATDVPGKATGVSLVTTGKLNTLSYTHGVSGVVESPKNQVNHKSSGVSGFGYE